MATDDDRGEDSRQGTDDVDDTTGPVSGAPTVTCSRCDDEWVLEYELDDLRAGNRAVEQFAMDHHHHTGHYPDDVTPWIAECRNCPRGEQFLAERPTRRFAETHARHTTHVVEVHAPEDEGPELISPRDHRE